VGDARPQPALRACVELDAGYEGVDAKARVRIRWARNRLALAKDPTHLCCTLRDVMIFMPRDHRYRK
jgi:hypothetical protein